MAPPLQAVIMKHIGASALVAFAAIVLGGASLIGVAFLGYGAQSQLSRWMSEGAAAIVVGVALLAGSFILVARMASSATNRIPKEQVHSGTQSARSLLTSNLSEIARTAVIGISAHRPIGMLAIAIIGGAVMLVLSEGDKDSRVANGRNPA